MSEKKTALEEITQGKRLTVGFHVTSGNFTIGAECMANLNAKIRKEEQKAYQSMLKSKEEYDNLLAKVNTLKELNKAPEQWSVS